MPLTQQQKDWVVTQSGYSPQTHQLDDDGYISEKPRTSMQPVVADRGTPQPKLSTQPLGAGSTFVKEAIHSAPATIMGGAGAILGAAAGGALVSGPFAPVGAVVGGIAGAMGLGMGTSYLQNKIEENVVPDYVQELNAAREAHPLAAMGGRLAAMPLGGMNPNLPNVGKALGTTAEVAKRAMLERSMRAALAQTKPSDIANLGNVGIGAGLGTGMAVGGQLAAGKPLGESLTSLETLEGLAVGALFNKPNTIGRRMGFHDVVNSEMQHALAAARELRANAKQAEQTVPAGMTPEQIAQAEEAKKGLYEKKEGTEWGLSSRDILSANQAAEQRGINPAKAAEMEAQRVAQAGLLTPEQIYQQKVQKELQRLQSLRRKADFEKATLELQQQQQNAQAEIAAAQAAKAEAKGRQQLQMKLGVQATPEAIAGRALAAPENRPATPRGNNKRVAAMQAEPIDPLQDAADAIQERLERKNQDPEEAVAPITDTELAQQVRAKGANAPVDDFVRTVFDAQAKTRGADVSAGDEQGSYALVSDQLRRMAAKIGTAEGSDTRAHEAIGHIFTRMLKLSPYKSDQLLYKQALALAEASPELKRIQAEQTQRGSKVWDAEEFIANQQGLEWLMADPAVRDETANKKWFRDFKVKMKSLMGNANAADVRRLINYKWHNDAPFEQYFGKHIADGAAGVGARVEQDQTTGITNNFDAASQRVGFVSKVTDPTPGSFQSISKHGNEAQAQLIADAVSSGRKPAGTISEKEMARITLPDNVEARKTLDRALQQKHGIEHYYYILYRKGDITAHNKLLTAKNVTERGQALGFTPEEIAEMHTRSALLEQSRTRRVNQDPSESMSPDEGFNSKEGDDIFSNNEDIEVNDALPTKLPTPPEGYRRVKVVAKDGSSYEAFFNDQYYGGTKELYGVDHDLASVAKMLPDGKLTHTNTRPGDRIEELPSQLYRRDQNPEEAIAPKGRTRTKEEHVAQQIERNRKAKEELLAIRGNIKNEKFAEPVNLVNKEGRPNTGKSSRNNVSLQTPLPGGGKLIDIIADANAVMPDEGIADTKLRDVNKVKAKETLKERIARKADEQLARLNEAAPDHAAAQEVAVVPKHVASTEAVHTAELDHSYADMHDIIKQGLKDLADKREDLVAEFGEDGDPVANIDSKIEKQQKMLEWVSKQDPTKRVDLKSVQKVYQDPSEAMTARDFMTSTERVLRNVKGFQPISQVLGTIKNKVPPAEWDMLQKAGIEKAFGPAQRVKADEVQQWVDANGPKAQVHTYGMEGKVSEAKREYDKMTHEWYENLDGGSQSLIRKANIARRSSHEEAVEKLLTQLSTENYTKAKRYIELGKQVFFETSTSPRATDYYNTVSALPTNEPMPEWTTTKSGKNVQKVDVVIPLHEGSDRSLKKTGYAAQGDMKQDPKTGEYYHDSYKELPKWQPDNLHENLPNTLGWAMVQYKTGPKGEKIAVIAEAQSRWGQEKRKYWDTYAKVKAEMLEAERNRIPSASELRELTLQQYQELPTAPRRLQQIEEHARQKAENSVRQYRPGMDHPLEKDYNRMILKAAIEQARKEGATHIMVSDAETAMMTEGHDLSVNPAYTKTFGSREDVDAFHVKHNLSAGETILQADDSYVWRINKRSAENYGVDKLEQLGFKLGNTQPQQEPGMRLNYDTILPKIAEELTGSKGEKVSLGEHKNAMDNYASPSESEDGHINKPRHNLIFKNTDGTPKTDVSGKLYPLPEARTEPFSYFEKRNQAPSEAMQPKDKADFYAETGVVGKGLLHTMASEVDKLKQMSPVAGKAVETFLAKLRARRGELEGGFNYAMKKVRKAQSLKEYWYQDNADYRTVVKWRDAMMDKGVEPFALTPTQKKINEVVDQNLKQSLELRESFKDEGDIEGLARGTKGTPHYLPHVMAREASAVLAENPTSAAAEKLFKEFLKYRTEVKKQSEADATKDWKTIRDSFNQLEEGNIASRFGAVDKAQGLGLPATMREQNLMDRMGRFNRRFARRVAYHEAIQRNPEAHDALFNSTKGLASNRVGKNVLQDMFGIREHQEATRSALSGVVRAAMLGPLTGAKDVVAGQVLGLQHMGLAQVLPAKMAALRDWSKSYERAVKTGIVREGYGGLESGEGGLKNIQAVLMRSRDVINQVQGRQMLETASRILNYGEGRYLALDAFNAIKAGRLDGAKRGFLDDFVPDWQKYKKGEVPTEVLDEAAAKYVESVQGTYDYRGLPEVAMKGTLSPYLSLARWNIEKFNNFTKHVVQPATKGNYRPLLMATLGAFIGGTAVNALVAEVTGRKERTATWDEIAESKEQTGLIAYKLAALASLAGYSGMMGDLIKSGFDAHYKNRVQSFSNPLVDAGGTVLEDTKFLVQALQQGDLPAATDVLHLLASDFIQAYRVALPHISEEKQNELVDANNRRDLKVWKMGEGMPLADSTLTRPNPLVNKDMRQFKETADVQEAAGLLPALIDKAIKNATDENGMVNPELLKAELSKYKRNSYQTVPSFERNPMAAGSYMNWLGKTQGPEVASRRIEDYVRRNAINKAKSAMVPSL